MPMFFIHDKQQSALQQLAMAAAEIKLSYPTFTAG